MSNPHTSGSDDHLALVKDYSRWIGVERTRSEVISGWPARALAATLDRDPAQLTDGARLPEGWHWIYFNEPTPASRLGTDGHEARGDFLPEVPLPRRMWAGGRLRFHAPLRIGDRAERTSVVEDVTPKRGRSGALVFVTVRHRIAGPEGLSVDEEQSIVYRAPPPVAAGDGGSSGGGNAERPVWGDTVARLRPDPVMLFRFSALTFNGHRIHYDHPYATEVEGYPGLVVHGPLLALLLLGAGVERSGGTARDFTYRALAPVFCGEDVEILAERDPSTSGEGARLSAFHPGRGAAMEARLR